MAQIEKCKCKHPIGDDLFEKCRACGAELPTNFVYMVADRISIHGLE